MRTFTVTAITALVLSISTASFAALPDVLWSENFDSYAAGDLLAQDASWTMVNTGVVSPYVTIDDSGIWPLTTPNGLKVGGTFPSTANTYNTVATKTLSPIGATQSYLEFDFRMYTSAFAADYNGARGYVNIATSGGAVITQLFFNRNGGVTSFNLNGTTFTTPSNDIHAYSIGLDFATQMATIAVDGTDQGLNASFMNAATPSDIGRLNFMNGTYYQGSQKVYFVALDDVSISQNPVPEPASLGLIALGGLMLIKRRSHAK